MPISRTIAAFALVALTGCDTATLTSLGSFGRKPVSGSAPEAVKLTDGLVVAGARGWCVDEATTRTDGGAAVVIFGSCAALRKDAEAPRPRVPGIVTVSVETATAQVPSVQEVEAYLRTDSGRAALSRNGEAQSVDILETAIEDDTVVLHAIDRSGFPRNAAAEYWRALFELNGRFVTVSMVAPLAAPISDGDQRAALDAQIETLKSVNSPG